MKVNVKVLKLGVTDKNGHKTDKVTISEPMPVTLNFDKKKIIGRACNFSFDKDCNVFADIILDKDSEHYKKLAPAIQGHSMESISSISVQGIGMVQQNADSSILSIEKQLNGDKENGHNTI